MDDGIRATATGRLTEQERLLFGQPFFVGVSLPVNDPELAIAAERGGAHAIKLHLNVEHRASGVTFGSWLGEKESIRAVRRAVQIPVGIMPGADVTRIAADAPHLYDEDFAFFDAYVEHIPASLLCNPPAPLMPALGFGATSSDIKALSGLDALCIEASVVNPSAYGEPLTLSDIMLYRRLAEATERPVVVASQKRLVPDDLEALIGVGCRGVLLGAIVLGRTAESIETNVRYFADAVRRHIGP